jgi:hypothetical protein
MTLIAEWTHLRAVLPALLAAVQRGRHAHDLTDKAANVIVAGHARDHHRRPLIA